MNALHRLNWKNKTIQSADDFAMRASILILIISKIYEFCNIQKNPKSNVCLIRLNQTKLLFFCSNFCDRSDASVVTC